MQHIESFTVIMHITGENETKNCMIAEQAKHCKTVLSVIGEKMIKYPDIICKAKNYNIENL